MPKHMVTYDLMETARNTNEWLGATARAMASYPAFGLVTNPGFQLMAAWGEVTERSFARMVAKPDWGIDTVVGDDGRDHLVTVRPVMERDFGDLVEFHVSGREPRERRVLLVAPMSGHYATLLRSTVRSLLPDCDVYVTDWHNARDIPVSRGKFDVEDYALYLADFTRALGPDIHVIAVCQPVPLALAATAWLAAEEPDAQPATLTLIGGPVDPDAASTDVTDFGHRVTMGQLERHIVQRVGFNHAGAGRMVYPGLLQLASFMSMNADRHGRAFMEQVFAVAKGEASDLDRHNRFYDEYLAVMDMTAEFYLSTVERVFKEREIARNAFTIGGRPVDLGRITDVAVHVVEGEQDDISAPGQCLAALDLLTGVPEERKAAHLEPGAGHYGIFAGGSWRRNIRPLVLSFIDAHARGASTQVAPPPPREPAPAPATLSEAERIAQGETRAGSIPAAPPARARRTAEPATRRRRGAAKADPATAEARRPARRTKTPGGEADAASTKARKGRARSAAAASTSPAAIASGTAEGSEGPATPPMPPATDAAGTPTSETRGEAVPLLQDAALSIVGDQPTLDGPAKPTGAEPSKADGGGAAGPAKTVPAPVTPGPRPEATPAVGSSKGDTAAARPGGAPGSTRPKGPPPPARKGAPRPARPTRPPRPGRRTGSAPPARRRAQAAGPKPPGPAAPRARPPRPRPRPPRPPRPRPPKGSAGSAEAAKPSDDAPKGETPAKSKSRRAPRRTGRPKAGPTPV